MTLSDAAERAHADLQTPLPASRPKNACQRPITLMQKNTTSRTESGVGPGMLPSIGTTVL